MGLRFIQHLISHQISNDDVEHHPQTHFVFIEVSWILVPMLNPSSVSSVVQYCLDRCNVAVLRVLASWYQVMACVHRLLDQKVVYLLSNSNPCLTCGIFT